jgi:hypothetical protein
MAEPNWKTKPWRSVKYTEWIRKQRCCCTDAFPPSINHHEQLKGHGGKGTKVGDERQVPLHWSVHNLMEDIGWSRPQVWATHDKDPEAIIADLQERYYQEFGLRPGVDKI